MYDVNECLTQVDAWNTVDNGDTPDGKKILEDKKDLISYLSNVTGWAPTLSKMADISDNLHALKLRNLTMPDWVSNNPFKKDLYDDVLEFAEIPQKLCAKYKPCRWLMAGYWLNDIVNNMQKLQNNTQKLKMFIYGTHNEIVTSLFWTMGVDLNGVEYNGAVIIEVKTKPSAQVRIIYSKPIEGTPEKRDSKVQKSSYCDSADWCPIDKFYSGTKEYVIPNYKPPCEFPVCFCGKAKKITLPTGA